MRKQIAEFNENTKRFNNGRYLWAWLDEVLCFIFLGAAPDDYYQYRFYKKNWHERKTFVTWRRSRNLIRENGAGSADIVEKDSLNKRLPQYLNRDWMEMKTATADEFDAFLDRHNGQAFMKPLGGTWGCGIFVLTKDEFEKNGRNIEQYRNYIAEERIVQSSVLSRLNPSSVNTVRVLTYKGEVMLCALKLGTGTAIVDNQHANGLNGNVDLVTGISNTPFYDRDMKEYYRHPTTGEMLMGVQVPNWEILKTKVSEAAKLIPEVPYLGWDVAITENDIAIIEANDCPDHDLVQRASQIGMYARIKEIKHGKSERE